jgi:hypothetical protein
VTVRTRCSSFGANGFDFRLHFRIAHWRCRERCQPIRYFKQLLDAATLNLRP